MTFSLLARDPETGDLGGAAATGSLCVGGWVLRGSARVGMSASQGASPSTLWGEAALDRLREGFAPQAVVDMVTGPDSGRDWRQLSALDVTGQGAAFTGAKNTDVKEAIAFPGGIAAGNLLSSDQVVPALVQGYLDAKGKFAERLIASLFAAQEAGSDSRGLLSAAILIVSENAAPLTLRVDYADDPLTALNNLYAKATSGEYGGWAHQVPTLNDPERGIG